MSESKEEPIAPTITFEEFMKVDLRVAEVISAEEVPNTTKMLKLVVSLNDSGTDLREVFAGIKLSYKPEELIGRLVVICANLEPRQMKFGLSTGMILAAGTGGSDVFILSPDNGAIPGQRIH